MVEVTQYKVTMVSRKSSVNRDCRSPRQSLQDRHFSKTQAASAAGESFNA